ncbi:GAF domain-containing hybrid sensor histidine kinase/response regulator [Microcoleus sp. PH2017_05_CCC_O_A]|uniref:hybrid sensor histidine kinase/response regulator n=1 Tax=Microcoleus sp. PH2017_05_CCC_O_A TaxID=2798816 RepID=UPI001D284555|nr:GAF domain-containing hybrid sensor histidine kinase/response regulator [Microcoleus sp. PH2017_05_CCC_O_A]MCC3438125.1 response regulator [Microcoleus sp. PH2017_05_CCC_O_A]
MKPKTLNRTLPIATFEAAYQLLEQMAELPGAIWLADDAIANPENGEGNSSQRFAAVVSARFSALLRGEALDELATNGRKHSEKHLTSQLNVDLTFDPGAIAKFLSPLADKLAEITPAPPRQIDIRALKQAINNIQPNSAILQSEFTLNLLDLLATDASKNSPLPLKLPTEIEGNSALKPIAPETLHHQIAEAVNHLQIASPCISFCQSVEDALQQQLEQERLLNQVTTQIRQSLELPVILSKAVSRVREFLDVDRLLIYQFEKVPAPHHAELGKEIPMAVSGEVKENPGSYLYLGRVTYEALASDAISSVLNFSEGAQCFPDGVIDREKYRKGLALCVTDVEITYSSHSCFLELMRRAKVRAKLLVPIVVQDELWGLLIAHQCTVCEWEESKKTFLRQIAEHLAIAIYQAELYAEVQQQKCTSEQRVIERTQELRDALATAQSASLAKSEFLAAMSHELRTPLTCVIGISDTLLRWSYGKVGTKEVPIAKQRQYLQTIRDSGDHLLELINDILDLSQVEAGKAVLKISEFSISKLASQSLHAFKEKAIAKGVELVQEQRIKQECDRFTADPRRLRQILFNLLGNAIKFTPEGGRIVLRVWVTEDKTRTPAVRQPGTAPPGSTAVFQIKDTGIGIPEDQRSLLFQKFQQLDSPYRREYGGTGLGLALTKQLVELHGGAIEVNSTVDVGSTFTVFIPMQTKSKDESTKFKYEKSNSSLPLHSSSLRGSLVLVEEDEETAMLICDILTAAGMQVVWMIEGSAAVEQIELLQPNAVIVDMRLPGMNGCEIIQQLRQKPATENLKILALSAKEIPADEISFVTAGANDCLAKPIHPEQLLDKILSLMGMGHGAWGMGHGAWGMGHGAWGMGHGAWGMGHGVWGMGHLI